MSTPNQICFLCLKQFAQEVKEKLVSNRGSSLFLQFTTFVSNYLRINVDNYRDLSDGNNPASAAVGVDAFCEVCSERVSHVCELYNELCSAELKLSAKLEEFGIIINNSSGLIVTERDDKGSTSSLLKSLAVKLVLQPETVSELRSSIVSKFIHKSINRDVFKMHEEIDGKDTEIKEEVESLSDQDDDDENEQISSEYECSESAEDNNRITLSVRTRLHVKREMDSEDDMPETQIHNELNEDSSSSDQSGGDTDPSWEDDDEFKSNIDDNNKSSYESETDDEEVKAFPQSQSHRKSPRKIIPQPSQRSSNTDDFILSFKNMIACEANECRLYFPSISELNAHLETHAKPIHSCCECNRGFLNPDLLTLHKLLHSKRVNGAYPCPSRSCSIKLHTAKQLQSHYNIKHGLGLGCFKCPKCELNLASESAFIAHLNKHDEAEDPSLPISEAVHCIAAPPCSICGLQFLRLQNLDEHRKEIHKLGVECPTCKKLYSNRTALSIHRSNHHKLDAEEIVCEACGKSFKTKSYLREHIITMHPDLVSRERLHQCSHCLMRFHRKRHRDIHVNKCESNPNPVKIPRPKSKTTRQKKALPKVTPCDVCGKPVKGSKDNMRRHLQTHEQTPIQCQVCGLVIEKSSFRKHMRTHKTLKPSVKLMDIKEESSSVKNPKSKAKAKKVSSDPTRKESFICDICGKEFKLKGILTVHLTRHHGIVSTADRKQCHICGNSYTSNGNLTVHMQIVHSDEKKFACHLCPQKTSVKMSLQKHLRRIHGRIKGQEFATDDGTPRWRKSKCRYPSCNQEFGEENELKLHVEREHQSQNEESGTPKFMCSLCGRIFVNQQRLTRHNEVHTKEKRYKCHICQKSLSQPSSVKEHLMAVHGVGKDQEYLSCTQLNCSFKTKGRSLLLKHLRSMHGVYTGKPREKSEGHDKVQS